MPPERLNPLQCDAVGCPALRGNVNHWHVVLVDESGIHIYEWDKAPKKAMDNGYHFCGQGHTINFVSKTLTSGHTPDPSRESTLELKPPLTREGTVPE